MSETDASFWLHTLAALMGMLWVAGTWFVLRTRSRLAEPLAGSSAIPAGPGSVTAAVARTLAATPLPGIVIEAADEREVRWRSETFPRHTGRLSVSGDAQGTRAAWEVTCPSVGLLRAAIVVVLLGGVSTAGIWWLLETHAAASQEPTMRRQVLQMVQAIHLLWPQVLFAGLARATRRRIGGLIERSVQNAPFA